MLDTIKVLFYGTRKVENKQTKKSKKVKGRASPKKEFYRLGEDEVGKAKAFHLYVRKSKRSQWIRATDELEVFPSVIRSIDDKIDYVATIAELALEAFYPPKKIRKPEPVIAKVPPIITPEPEIEVASEEEVEAFLAESEARLDYPSLPEEPRVSITKKQFSGIMANFILDELNAIGTKWTAKRINALIAKLWRGYSKQPYLIASGDFARNLVIKEIIDIRQEEAFEKAKTLQDDFRKQLESLDVSLDPDIVGGDVRVQFKEVFNKQRMKKEDEMEMTKRDRKTDKPYTAPRQAVFTQVVVDYNEFIQVNSDDILGNQELLKMSIDKVRSDVYKIFKESLDKGIFSFGDEPEYSVRLVMPMLNTNGEIPEYYLNDKTKDKLNQQRETTGYGYSTKRMTVSSLDDLDDLMDELFADLPATIARYVAVNSAIGMGFTGFMIERLLK